MRASGKYTTEDEHVKLNEVLNPPLEESKLKKALTGAAMAAGLVSGAGHLPHKTVQVSQPLHVTPTVMRASDHEALVHAVKSKFDVDKELASKIVQLAQKYEHEVFPKAKDILAVVSVESSFDPEAKSKLSKDPAIGLMQVRPGVWKLDPAEVRDIEKNIKHGSRILADYYKRFNDKRKALMAYNAGPTGMKTSSYAPEYANKVERERQRLAKSLN